MHGTIKTLRSAASQTKILNYSAVRVAVVLTALGILFLRMPAYFANPQFWAEDGPLFFKQAMEIGSSSLFLPAAGYFTVLQRLVALAGTIVPTALVPTFYTYFAIAFALLAVWIATSPRLGLPLRPLLALAIVVAPGGYEVLGLMGNTQWLVPVIVMLLLMLQPSGNRLVLAGEAILCAVLSVTGPFAIFLIPVAVAFAVLEQDVAARNRLIVLIAVMLPGLGVTCHYMITHSTEATIPSGLPFEPSPWHLWITLPFRKFANMFGASDWLWLRSSKLAMLTMVSVIVIACLPPYRPQKLAMLFLGSAVMLSGMMKYRGLLHSQLFPGTTRYFYAENVFLIWMLCCWAGTQTVRAVSLAAIGAIVAIEMYAVFLTVNTPQITEDFKWKSWAAQIDSGKSVRVPISPRGWFISLDR